MTFEEYWEKTRGDYDAPDAKWKCEEAWNAALYLATNSNQEECSVLTQISEHYSNIKKIENSSMNWEAKYNMIFAVAGKLKECGVSLDYCDPDTSYEEDVVAYIRALDEVLANKSIDC